MKKNKIKKQPYPPFIQAQKWLFLFIIFFISFGLYTNTIHHGFVLDDDLVCLKNKFVQDGDICKLLTSAYHEGFTKKPDSNYRPLSMIAFAIEYKISTLFNKKEPSAFVFHFFNVFWYAISCGFLFIFLRHIFHKEAAMLAFGISLLFAAHPIHTEVVANIKSRDEIYVFLGLISTLYTILKYEKSGAKKWLIASLCCYFLACLSKENALPIIGLVPISLYFWGKPNSLKNILNKSMYFLIPLVLYGFINHNATGDNGEQLGVIDNILYTEGISYGERLATAIGMVGKYIQLLVFPHPLSYDYSAYQIPVMNWATPQVFVSLLGIIGSIGYALTTVKSKNPISWAILLFTGMFVLVSNLFFIIGTTMAERLLFSPSLGFCVLLGYILFKFLYKKKKNLPFYLLLFGITTLYSYKTMTRNLVWHSDESLHISGKTTAQNSARALSFYGLKLYRDALKESHQQKQIQLTNEAITYFEHATQQVNSYRDAYHNKGICYLNVLKNYDAAILAFNEAITLDPDYATAIAAKGIAYHKKGVNDVALKYLRQAHELSPNNLNIEENLIIVLLKIRDIYRTQGDIETAISYDKQVKVLRGEAIQ